MKELTCIVCPNGCRIRCEEHGGDYLITGNSCRRGEEYAFSEMTQPMRTLTTTLRTVFPDYPALPVRTDRPIPKEKLFDVMRALKDICVDTRVSTGNIVVARVSGLDSNIIATGSVPPETERSK